MRWLTATVVGLLWLAIGQAAAQNRLVEFVCAGHSVQTGETEKVRFQLNRLERKDGVGQFWIRNYASKYSLDGANWDTWLQVRSDYLSVFNIVWTTYSKSRAHNGKEFDVPIFRYRLNIKASKLIKERALEPSGTVAAYLISYHCTKVFPSDSLIDS